MYIFRDKRAVIGIKTKIPKTIYNKALFADNLPKKLARTKMATPIATLSQ